MWKKLLISLFGSSLLLAPALVFAQDSTTGSSGGSSSECLVLSRNLRRNMRDTRTDNEVTLLQRFLVAHNYLSAQPNGEFGPLTETAVKQFQLDNGLITNLSEGGIVRQLTRNKIAEISGCNGGSTSTSSRTVSVNQQFDMTQGEVVVVAEQQGMKITANTIQIRNCSGAIDCAGPNGTGFVALTVQPSSASDAPQFMVLQPGNRSNRVGNVRISLMSLSDITPARATLLISLSIATSSPPTEPPRGVQVTYPNTSGITLTRGASTTIQWKELFPASLSFNVALVPQYPQCIKAPCPLYAYAAPYVIASKVTFGKDAPDFHYDWKVGDSATDRAIPDGTYKISICHADFAPGESACDESDNTFQISSTGNTENKLEVRIMSGNKDVLQAGVKTSIAIKGVETFDRSAGEPTEGYNVQYFIRADNDSYSLQGGNAVYNPATAYWDAEFTPPIDTSKTYLFEAAFYCSQSQSVCRQRHPGQNEQVSVSFSFQTSGVGTQPVTVVSTNGNESYGIGGQLPVIWTADCGYSTFHVGLIKGTSMVETIRGNATPASCAPGQTNVRNSLTWTIPATLAPGNDYKVWIYGSKDSGFSGDVSNNYFSIGSEPSQSYLTVTTPNTGNETWTLGENKNITWDTNVNRAVNITLISHPVYCITTPCPTPGPKIIAQNWTDKSPYPWTAGKLNDSSYVSPGQYKIQICTIAIGRERIVCDESDNWFTLSRAPIQGRLTVTAPNNGEQWQLGSTHMILWTPYNPQTGLNTHPTVQAYLDRFENGRFVEVGKIMPGGKASIHWDGDINAYGTYPTPGTNYYIRIVNTSTGASDRSDRAFTLVARNTIKVDLKINGSDGPIAAIGDKPIAMIASWTSNADTCSLYNGTATSPEESQIMNLPSSGKRTINVYPNFENWNKSINFWCSAKIPEGSGADSVEVLPTVGNGPLTLTAPNSGESWQLGSTHMILWKPYSPQANLNTHPTVQAYLDRLENDVFVEVGKVLPSGKASIHWNGEIDTYGKYPPPGNNYYIRIVNTATGMSDRSDIPFKLLAQNTLKADLKINGSDGPLTIPTPVPSDGKPITMPVTWSSNTDSCSIYNNTDPSNVNGQINNLPGAGDRLINVYPNFENWSKYISLSCLSKNPEGQASDSIEVLPNTANRNSFVSINTPNGGEQIALNASYPITLRHNTDITRVSLVLYKNDASFRYVITDLPVNLNASETTYQWTPARTISTAELAAAPGAIYKIYAIAYKTSGGTVTDMSDAPFSIAGSILIPCKTIDAVKVGDFNRDSVVSQEEITKMIGFANGITPTADELKIGDGTGDGKITLSDIQLATNNKLGGSNCVLGPITSQKPTLTVTTPIGGDKWLINSKQNISWRWVNGKDTKLRVQLQKISGDKFTKELAPDGIESGFGGLGFTPTSEIPEGNYIVEVCDSYFAAGTFICGQSAQFDIEQPLSATLIGVTKLDAHKASVGLSIKGIPENKFVTSWKLSIECPQGVSVLASKSTTNMCGTQQTYSASAYADVTQDISILTATAENLTGSAKTISFTLEATGNNGKVVSATPYNVSLAALTINPSLIGKSEIASHQGKVTLSIKGFPTNTYVSSWRLNVTCPQGVIVVKDVVTNLCGTQTIAPSATSNVTLDFPILSAGITNTTSMPQKVTFTLTVYGPNGIVEESAPYIVSLTAPMQSGIQVTYPNAAGTVIVPGGSRPVVITWKNLYNVDAYRGFNIFLMDANTGAKLQQLAFGTNAHADFYYWYIPSNFAFQGGQYRIMISSAADPSIQDTSDEPFTIRGPQTPPSTSTGTPGSTNTTASTIDALRQALANLQQILESLRR